MDKIDAVLAGQFRISMQAESVVLRAGDAVYVPKNVEHIAEVVGTDPVVSLDAVKLS
jgi:mannose-6-phosphate isomerase-like protein (cupin superfamily)